MFAWGRTTGGITILVAEAIAWGATYGVGAGGTTGFCKRAT